MKSLRIILFFFMCHASLLVVAQNQGMSSYNVVWNSPSKNASESMPLVGGDMGCNVWVEDGDVLFYMQRSGCFSENGEYLKLGRVRLRFDPNPFEDGASFSQELKLEEGYVQITGSVLRKGKAENTQIKLWVDVNSSVIHADIISDTPINVLASYESWRTKDKERKAGGQGERWGVFNLEGYPGKVISHKDHVSFDGDKILFLHRNSKNSLIPGVLVEQQGLEAYKDQITDDIKNRTFGGVVFGKGFIPLDTLEGQYAITPFKGWRLKSTNYRKKHHLIIASHVGQYDQLEEWKKQLDAIAGKAIENYKTDFKTTTQWWETFWDRSWIRIKPENTNPADKVWQMGRNYQLFRYQLGGNVSGEYPTKFNGGNLTFDPSLVDATRNYDPDWRAWGGATFTAQNQRLLYWPLLKTGDFEVMLPQFELYRKGLGGAEARVKKHFGHKGGVFSEYMSVPGLALGAGYGWKGTKHRQRGSEIPFGDVRADALKGYNDPVEPGVMANAAVSYHWESQVEHAYMLMEYYRYSGADISSYIPFIKSALVFFDEHYQKRQLLRDGKSLDDNGKLVFYPSTSCESYRGAKNPADLISGIHACISLILDIGKIYFTKEELEYFENYRERLPDYSYGEINGKQIIKPAESWGRYQNVECPQFYPLFPFNQFHLWNTDMTIFRNTWEFGDFPKDMVISWHQDGAFYARMGMTQKAAEYNVKKLQDSERRFPTFWGPGHDWVPDHNWGGSGMIGLQEMLMQCFDGKIYLFPAWPKEWDVDFKLHAPQKTTVEGKLKNGELTSLKVFPEHRTKDVILSN